MGEYVKYSLKIIVFNTKIDIDTEGICVCATRSILKIVSTRHSFSG